MGENRNFMFGVGLVPRLRISCLLRYPFCAKQSEYSMQPPLFHHSRRIITEPDQFGDAVTGIDLSVDFQRRQNRASQVEQFQSREWALDFGTANVQTRVRGVLRDGWGSFCLALGRGEAVWNGHPAAKGGLCLLPPGEELDGRTTSEFAWLTAAVPPAIWNQCLALSGNESGPNRLTVIHLSKSMLASMIHHARLAQFHLNHGSAATDQAKFAADTAAAWVLDAFTSACEQVSGSEPVQSALRNRARVARLADAWMREHLDREVQVPDLCLALRVSRRELEYAFRTVYDISPREHFEILRLNAIRRALLRKSDATVTTVAYAHGVTHLSRFAAKYYALFGEKPSETKRSPV